MAGIVAAYTRMLVGWPFLTKYCSTFCICCASVHLSQRMSGMVNIPRMLSYAALVGVSARYLQRASIWPV
jgi:hypothetical protein